MHGCWHGDDAAICVSGLLMDSRNDDGRVVLFESVYSAFTRQVVSQDFFFRIEVKLIALYFMRMFISMRVPFKKSHLPMQLCRCHL